MKYPYVFAENDFGRIDDWVDATWSLQEQVSLLAQPIIEIAGPTTGGYYWLDGIEFPTAPIITNINTKRSAYVQDEKRDEIISEDVDVRHMPWANGSVDMLLCSCISIVHERKYMEYLYNDKPLPEELDVEWANRVSQARHMATQIMLGVASLEAADDDMLRLSFIKESLRVLSPRGIVVVEGVLADEIAIMQQHGLKLRRLQGDYSADRDGKIDSELRFSAVLSR